MVERERWFKCRKCNALVKQVPQRSLRFRKRTIICARCSVLECKVDWFFGNDIKLNGRVV